MDMSRRIIKQQHFKAQTLNILNHNPNYFLVSPYIFYKLQLEVDINETGIPLESLHS